MPLSIADLNRRTGSIINAALKIHRFLGPGVLESAYHTCLTYELERSGLMVERQVAIPLIYERIRLDAGYRADMVVDREIVIEIKAVETLARIHEMQLVSYLRLGGFRVGLLINFHEARLKDGIRRRVNRL